MLTSKWCAARRARLWTSLPAPCDVLVVTSPESLAYFANYIPSPFVFNSVESAAALVLWPGRSVLIGDNLLRPFLDRAHADEVVCLEWYTGRKSAGHRGAAVAAAVAEQLRPVETGQIGVESLGLAERSSGRRVVLDTAIRTLRRAKDPDERALIRASAWVGEAAHAAALQGITPGMTELDAFLLVQTTAERALGQPGLVYGDFVSGSRCETERGGPPSSRVIQRGDLFLLDFSVVVYGYRADFTNTFIVDSTPTAQQRDLESACLEALRAGEALLRPGIPARQIDAAVRGHFTSLGLDQFFPSHTGHGLGLGHPEPPYLVPDSDETLQVHDVIALEPGLYVPGVGGMRFERNYLITDDGAKILTRHHLGLTV